MPIIWDLATILSAFYKLLDKHAPTLRCVQPNRNNYVDLCCKKNTLSNYVHYVHSAVKQAENYAKLSAVGH